MDRARLLRHFDTLADTPDAVAKLRELVLSLAVQGRLVRQSPKDEPANALIQRLYSAKRVLAKEVGEKPMKELPAPDEDELPFTLPSGWAATRLGNLTTGITSGYSPQCEGRPRSPDEWGVLKISAVSWGRFDPDENKALPATIEPRKDFEVSDGDFLMSRANTAELVARSVIAVSPPPRLLLCDKILRVGFTEHSNRSFLNLLNNSSIARAYYATAASGTSSSMKNIGREGVAMLPVALPPLAEQKRIVARVEELLALCDELDARQTAAREQRTRLVQSAFDHLTAARDDSEFRKHSAFCLQHSDSLFDSVPALRQAILSLAVQGRLVLQNSKDEPAERLLAKIDAERARRVAAKKLEASPRMKASALPEDALPSGWCWAPFGRVSFCRDGERIPVNSDEREGLAKTYDYYGASGVIDKIDRFLFDEPLLLIGEDGANLVNRSTPIAFIAEGKYWVNNHAHVLDAIDRTLLEYLRLYINAIDLKPYLTGMAQPKMNQAQMNSIPVPLPPLAEQQRIVAKVAALMSWCDELEARLAAAQSAAAALLDSSLHALLAPAASSAPA